MAAEAGPHPCWEFLDCEGEVPQSRSGHTCALYKNRYFYIFGGFDGSNCFDDLYVLDLEHRQWRRINAGGERPSGRASHSAVTDELAGVMYIFGGSGSHFGYTNKRDLCEFCFETECWRVLSNPHEDMPSARYGQSMVSFQEGLYVWGGTHGTNYPTDMHRFDLCSKQWDFVATSGELPCGRYRHQAMVRDDLMYIVGGSGVNRYGDVFTFQFGSSVWRKLVCTGTDLSDGRYAHSAVLRDGYIYLYGGNDGARHDDLQQLDLDTRVWSRVVVHGQCPPGRDFHAAVLRRDSMVIFGGSNGSRRHNDVFEFHMAPKIPPSTLSSDLEALLEQAQIHTPTQLSCDLFLAADSGQSSQGMYCHSHLLLVRCPRLYELVEARVTKHAAGPPKEWAAHDVSMAPAQWLQNGRGSSTGAAAAPAGAGEEGMAVDESEGVGAGAGGVRQATPRPSSAWPHDGHVHCAWAPVEMQYETLQYFLHFLYTDSTKFGRIMPEHLYRLFLAAKLLEVPRLAAMCERQLKVRLAIDSVLPLLRASAADGPAAQPVQDACKHYFLANFQQCMELREAEDLGQKLLCELVRLHNARVSAVMGVAGPRAEPLLSGTRPLPGPTITPVPIPPQTLAEDLKRLLAEEIRPDFEVVVQEEVIRVHRFVLVARSGYFASCILTSGMVEAQAGRLVIPGTSHMTAEAFRTFLRFLYAGDDILDCLAPTAMYLVDASSFYGLTNSRLKHFCEFCVKESFNEEHVLQLFEASTRLGVEGVRHMALDFIVAHFQAVSRQSAMEQLDKPLLVDIIRGLAEKFPTAPAAACSSAPQCLG